MSLMIELISIAVMKLACARFTLGTASFTTPRESSVREVRQNFECRGEHNAIRWTPRNPRSSVLAEKRKQNLCGQSREKQTGEDAKQQRG